jgi:heat shock protein HslJ
MTRRTLLADVLVVGLLLGAARCRPASEKSADITPSTQDISQDASAGLGGTSWRLVKFQGGDGLTLTPDDKAKYTIAFGTDGRLGARIDCNRGTGTWKSSGPPQLEFGPLALTRAMCPPGSLHDRMVKHWPYVRSYVMKDGHLFVSLMADGGIYQFEPASPEEKVEGAVKGTATSRAATESLENTYWKLMHLGDAPVTVASRQAEPHLIINSLTRRAGGSGGCNRFGGSYELNGDRLSLGPMAATMMACAEGTGTEKAFLEALGRVSGWRITGQQLELLDAAGKVVAPFEARHME